jgi:hypothetical protein
MTTATKKTAKTATTKNGDPKRDRRVDEIGLLKALIKQHLEPLIEKVRGYMDDNEIGQLLGTLFTAKLIEGATETIDPGKFLKLWENGEMTRKDLIGCLKVTKKPACEVVPAATLRRRKIMTTNDPTVSLRVVANPGVDLGTADVIDGVDAIVRKLQTEAKKGA